MRVLGIFATVALFASAALAEINLTQLLAEIPTCTQVCAAKVVLPAKCALTDLPNCLCTNTSLQFDFAVCVLESCDLEDQFVSSTILQNEICKGVPIESRSNEIIRDVIIISAFTFVIVGLRFYARLLVTTHLWWDDWTIAFAATIMIAMTIIPIFNATRGFGKHFWDVPPENLELLRKLYYISQILYVVVQSLAKFSILLLYLRVFPSKRFRLIVQIAIGWMICHTIAFGLVVSLQCVPVPAVWDLTVHGNCTNSQAFVYAAAGFSIFEDFIIMVLPVWELKDLNLTTKKKLALTFLFALGSFACITSMIRLKYIVAYGTSVDVTYGNVDVILWSVLEDYVAIICASLMCFRPLVVKFLPTMLPTTNLSESKHTQSQGWGGVGGSKLGSKLGGGKKGYELHSQDGDGKDKHIRVQKTWATQTSSVDELPERSYSIESNGRGDDMWQGRRI